MNVCVMGLGYIGLPTAALIAHGKTNVLGVDINQDVVNTINSGKIHIVEPDLDRFVHDAVQDGYLKASNRPESSDVFIIAVPTPFKSTDESDHEPDVKYVESAMEMIRPVLKAGDLILLESTSPVGTTEDVICKAVIQQGFEPGVDVYVAHCPERVLPGKIMTELIENDRIIGGINRISAEKARSFYKRFVDGECVITDSKTAELAKLVENAYRDVNIAFANELSRICDGLGINVF